jgi:hypothetical protein
MKKYNQRLLATLLFLFTNYSFAQNPIIRNQYQMYNGVWSNADEFNKKVKVVYVSIGTAEPERMYTGVKGFHEALEKAGIKHIY